jgi:N-acetylglucosaminyl-diphospho-decaprenol L-rhamnosyltransferase
MESSGAATLEAVLSAPSVDVLIVSLNTREVLRDTLASLFRHAPSLPVAELKVSVFDNGSTDGSAEMVSREFPHVRLHTSTENLGFARANNYLASRSDADYLLLLNSDVILTEDLVSPLLSALNGSPRAIAAGPRLVFPDGRIQYSAPRVPSLRAEFADELRGTRLGRALRPVFDSDQVVAAARDAARTDERHGARITEFLWATCWLMRRDDVVRDGLFDESFPMYDEDLDFCTRAVARGRTFLYVPEVELVHLGGASTKGLSAKLKLTRAARRRYYSRHHGGVAAHVYKYGLTALDALIRFTAAIPVSRNGLSRAARPPTT